MNIKRCSGAFGFCAIFGTAYGTDTPQPPTNPTIEDCRTYRHAIHLSLQETHRQYSACTRERAPQIRRGKYCTWSGNIKTDELRAWPECSEAIADTECSLIKAQQRDVPACFAEATANATATEKSKLAMAEFNGVESQAKKIQSLARDIESAWNDPKRFIAEKIKTKTEEWIKRNLLDANGRFTERGQTLAQESYDFIFNSTLGNAGIYSNNPIIAGIQRSAADNIKRAHSQAIRDLERLIEETQQISIPSSPGTPPYRSSVSVPSTTSTTVGPSSTRPSAPSANCAILDTEARTDLAINEPERYEQLLMRCSKR